MSVTHETIPLKDFTEKAYLDYSMYVILDRALPNLARRQAPAGMVFTYVSTDVRAFPAPAPSAQTLGRSQCFSAFAPAFNPQAPPPSKGSPSSVPRAAP